MNLSPFGRPSPEEHQALMAQIEPLPLRGRAWPRWIAAIAWIIMAVIAVRLIIVLQLAAGQALPMPVIASLVVCFGALLGISVHMWTSVTGVSD